MTIWEYNVGQGINLGGEMTAVNLQKCLDKQGLDGWEYVGSITTNREDAPLMIFKRPMEIKRVGI